MLEINKWKVILFQIRCNTNYLLCGILSFNKVSINFRPNSTLCNPIFKRTVSKFCKAKVGRIEPMFNSEQQASKNPLTLDADWTILFNHWALSMNGMLVAAWVLLLSYDVTLKHCAKIRNQPKLVFVILSSSMNKFSLVLWLASPGLLILGFPFNAFTVHNLNTLTLLDTNIAWSDFWNRRVSISYNPILIWRTTITRHTNSYNPNQYV